VPPPPGRSPHPIGQGLAVAVRPRRSRARVLLVAAVLLTVAYLAVLVLLGLVVRASPAVAPVLVVFSVVGTLSVLMVIGQAIIVRGPALVVDDAGIRLRDLVGWVQVPWATLQGIAVTAGGRVLTLEAPGGVYLNDKRTRRARQLYRLDGLEVQRDDLLAYLEHRRGTAPRPSPPPRGRA
jgi:hypothetical protein